MPPDEQMEQAHRNDYEYERKLREARMALRAVLETERPGRGTTKLLEDAVALLTAEMNRIVARWD